jgi:TPR repeat protein
MRMPGDGSFTGLIEAAWSGDTAAQLRLGLARLKGEGLPRDYAEATHWLHAAAAAGLAEAQLQLGSMYIYGRGVSCDFAEAARWFFRAAEQGHATAQFNLGYLYRKGQGIPQDNRQAVHWYGLAAAQGNRMAQNNLGVMHEQGFGVPQDFDEAERWYRQAAEAGDRESRANLDFLARGRPLVPLIAALGEGDLSTLSAVTHAEKRDSLLVTSPGSPNDTLWTELVATGWARHMSFNDLKLNAPTAVAAVTKAFQLTGDGRDALRRLLPAIARTRPLAA